VKVGDLVKITPRPPPRATMADPTLAGQLGIIMAEHPFANPDSSRGVVQVMLLSGDKKWFDRAQLKLMDNEE
jgi:hypothetical protein